MDQIHITNGVIGSLLPALKATTTGIQTTNAITYKIDGQVYSLGANANGVTAGYTAIPSTITVPAASTGSIGVYVNPLGSMSFVQGTTFSNATLTANSFYGLQGTSTTVYSTQTATSVYSTTGLPGPIPNNALLGWAIVSATSTNVWTGGTSSLAGTGGFVVTFLDNFGFVGI